MFIWNRTNASVDHCIRFRQQSERSKWSHSNKKVENRWSTVFIVGRHWRLFDRLSNTDWPTDTNRLPSSGVSV